MQTLRIALIALARSTFDLPLAGEMTARLRRQLEAAGHTLLGPQEMISDLPAAQAAARSLAGETIDLLLVLQATFADSTLVGALAEALQAPLLLWAVPEARTGGRLRLNSLCGINLAAHALTLQNKKYSHVYALPEDAAALQKAQALALAGRARRSLAGARLGVVGSHPAGMASCHLDAPALHDIFGLRVNQYPLDELLAQARAIPAAEIAPLRARLDARLDNLADLEQTALAGTLKVYAALRRLTQQENLSGLAVRCWPEFFTELGSAACGAMSMLSDECIPCSCEADINGTVTQYLLQLLSDEPAFGSDLVSVESENDIAVLWHCGLAPLAMADPAVQPHGGIHSNRRVPLVMEFPLKPGPVTLARLSQASGRLQLVVGRGEMLSAPPSFSGTSGVLRFERPVAHVLDDILNHGLEHHVSLTYGDHLPALLALADLLELPVLKL